MSVSKGGLEERKRICRLTINDIKSAGCCVCGTTDTRVLCLTSAGRKPVGAKEISALVSGGRHRQLHDHLMKYRHVPICYNCNRLRQDGHIPEVGTADDPRERAAGFHRLMATSPVHRNQEFVREMNAASVRDGSRKLKGEMQK